MLYSQEEGYLFLLTDRFDVKDTDRFDEDAGPFEVDDIERFDVEDATDRFDAVLLFVLALRTVGLLVPLL